MDASVVEFVGSSFANVDDFDVKMECFPSQRMIGIDVDVFVADVDDPKGERFTVFGFAVIPAPILNTVPSGKIDFGTACGSPSRNP